MNDTPQPPEARPTEVPEALPTELPAAPVDVAVIGGGLAGLTAAATAARTGARTVLIDARSVGGRARSAERDGYTLNEGGHALYRTAGGWDVLTGLGVRPVGGDPPLDDAFTVWNGSIVRLPSGTKDALVTRILSMRSKVKLGGWLRDPGELADRAGDESFDEWLTTEGARDDLRKYILTIGRLITYSARPEELPARTMLRQLATGLDGVLYLAGGWQSLVDDLRAAATDAGVDIIEGAPATAIERDGAHWAVATKHGVVDTGSVVIAAGGPRLAVDLLGADDAGWVERSGPVVRAACLDVGGHVGDRSILLSSDEPLYCSRDVPAAPLAPDGRALYSLMRYLAADDDTSATDNRAILDAHAAMVGLPDRGDREFDRFLAAPVVAWGSPQVGVARPTGSELADRGVFAAGDWVGDRLLADASLVSGSAAGTGAARHSLVAV